MRKLYSTIAHLVTPQQISVRGPVDEHLWLVLLGHVHNASVGGQVSRLQGLLQGLLDGDPGTGVELEGMAEGGGGCEREMVVWVERNLLSKQKVCTILTDLVCMYTIKAI